VGHPTRQRPRYSGRHWHAAGFRAVDTHSVCSVRLEQRAATAYTHHLVHRDAFLRVHLPGFLLVFALLLSVAFYLLMPPDRISRTLYFPGNTDAELSGEMRLVPRTSNRERAIELVVEEVLLGPSLITHGRLFPRESEANAVILNGDTVYVDLDDRSIVDSSDVRVTTVQSIDALRYTLLHNFRFLESVVVTVDGNVPFVPAYRQALR